MVSDNNRCRVFFSNCYYYYYYYLIIVILLFGKRTHQSIGKHRHSTDFTSIINVTKIKKNAFSNIIFVKSQAY